MDTSDTSSSSSSSASSVPACRSLAAGYSQQETSGVSTAEGGSSAGQLGAAAERVNTGTSSQALSTEVDKRLQDPEVKKKLVETLRREVEELDCFWAKLEDHAIDTCGEKASEA